MKVFAFARDEDGQISRFEIDYGDGSPRETYQADVMKCQRTPSGWPAASQSTLGAGKAHHFTKPGTYTITVTAWSTGCDGTMPQSGSTSFTYVVF
jgi:surface-anchored protein